MLCDDPTHQPGCRCLERVRSDTKVVQRPAPSVRSKRRKVKLPAPKPQSPSEPVSPNELLPSEGSHFFDSLEEGLTAFNRMFCYIVAADAVVRLSDFEVFAPEPFAARQYGNWFYATVDSKGNKDYDPLAPEWIRRADRRQRDTMTYAPGQKLYYRGQLNRWRGLGVRPVKGDISPWNELLDFIFPDAPNERRWCE